MEPFANETVGGLATPVAVMGSEGTFSGTVEVLAFRQRLAKVMATEFDKARRELRMQGDGFVVATTKAGRSQAPEAGRRRDDSCPLEAPSGLLCR